VRLRSTLIKNREAVSTLCKLLGIDVAHLHYAHVYGVKPARWFSVSRVAARDWEGDLRAMAVDRIAALEVR
jgi:hypothetical protein